MKGGAEPLTVVLLLVRKKKGLGTRRGLRNADLVEEMSTVALWKNWVGERKKLDWAIPWELDKEGLCPSITMTSGQMEWISCEGKIWDSQNAPSPNSCQLMMISTPFPKRRGD